MTSFRFSARLCVYFWANSVGEVKHPHQRTIAIQHDGHLHESYCGIWQIMLAWFICKVEGTIHVADGSLHFLKKISGRHIRMLLIQITAIVFLMLSPFSHSPVLKGFSIA